MEDEKPIDDVEIMRILGEQFAKTYGSEGVKAQKDLERIAAKLRQYEKIIMILRHSRESRLRFSEEHHVAFPEFVAFIDSMLLTE